MLVVSCSFYNLEYGVSKTGIVYAPHCICRGRAGYQAWAGRSCLYQSRDAGLHVTAYNYMSYSQLTLFVVAIVNVRPRAWSYTTSPLSKHSYMPVVPHVLGHPVYSMLHALLGN